MVHPTEFEGHLRGASCHTAVAVSATFDEPSRSVRSLFSQPTTIIFLLSGDTSDIS
jgi:hypothetical protein